MWIYIYYTFFYLTDLFCILPSLMVCLFFGYQLKILFFHYFPLLSFASPSMVILEIKTGTFIYYS